MENYGNWFQISKKFCSFIFSIILAFACDDRTTTVDAICECQTSWAFCKIYILVSTATRSWNTGNLLIGTYFQLLLCLALFFLISFFHFFLHVFCLYFGISPCFPCLIYYFLFFLLSYVLFLNAIDMAQYVIFCFEFQNCINKELKSTVIPPLFNL